MKSLKKKILPWNELKSSILQEEPLHNYLVAPVNCAACEFYIL